MPLTRPLRARRICVASSGARLSPRSGAHSRPRVRVCVCVVARASAVEQRCIRKSGERGFERDPPKLVHVEPTQRISRRLVRDMYRSAERTVLRQVVLVEWEERAPGDVRVTNESGDWARDVRRERAAA
jgi:hypothetical protein